MGGPQGRVTLMGATSTVGDLDELDSTVDHVQLSVYSPKVQFPLQTAQ